MSAGMQVASAIGIPAHPRTVPMRMPMTARALTAIAALLLLALYVLPLWSIRLTAPQYPEGLGMHIGISTITGFTEFDLQQILHPSHELRDGQCLRGGGGLWSKKIVHGVESQRFSCTALRRMRSAPPEIQTS